LASLISPNFWRRTWASCEGVTVEQAWGGGVKLLGEEVNKFWMRNWYGSPVSWTHSPAQFYGIFFYPFLVFFFCGYYTFGAYEAKYAAELSAAAYGQGGVFVKPPPK